MYTYQWVQYLSIDIFFHIDGLRCCDLFLTPIAHTICDSSNRLHSFTRVTHREQRGDLYSYNPRPNMCTMCILEFLENTGSADTFAIAKSVRSPMYLPTNVVLLGSYHHHLKQAENRIILVLLSSDDDVHVKQSYLNTILCKIQ